MRNVRLLFILSRPKNRIFQGADKKWPLKYSASGTLGFSPRFFILLIVLLLLNGCSTMQANDKSAKDDSKNVRVSGDITVSTVNRKGF